MEKTREELKKANQGQSDSGDQAEEKVDGDEKPAAEPAKESALKQEAVEDSNVGENQTLSVDPSAAAVKPSPKSTPKTVKAASKKEVQSEESAKVKASSRSSTPCRELEVLTSVPKHLIVDEHEVLYSNTGRIQRNRKKPTIYDPKTGPDSGWKGEDSAKSPAPAEAAEDNAKTPETPAAQPEKPPPKKRGPKPGKKKGKKKKVSDSSAGSGKEPLINFNCPILTLF